MSGIFGIFNRNGEPVVAEILEDMHTAMSYWHPDTSGVWREGAIGLGHAMLWNTPESKLDQLPQQQNPLVITMDARLDNREELASLLEMPRKPLAKVTDSDFILAAYRKWGEDCPAHLLGDFAFAIWDTEKQQLFCARDHVGIKPFYYHISDNRFIFSNHINGLKAHPDIDLAFDQKMIAYYLRNEDYAYKQTFFQSIKKLPPASSLLISAEQCVQRLYWDPQKTTLKKLGSEAEYSHKLQDLLKQAVTARLRSTYPVSAHLSGGLDSSTIAALAARELAISGQQLNAYNWIAEPVGGDLNYYEWSYSKLLARQEGIKHNSVELDLDTLTSIFKNHDISYGDSTDLWYEYPLRQQLKKSGSRVLLSGWGGDELVTYNGAGYISDLFYRGKIKQSFQEFRKNNKQQSTPLAFHQALWRFLKRIAAESLPGKLLCLLGKSGCYLPLPLKYSPAAFTTFSNNLPPLWRTYNAASMRKRQLNMFQNGHIQARIDAWAAAGMGDRVEYSYPLLDKRLIEYALALPAELYYKNGLPRYITREAMRGILPDEIRLNTEKDEPIRVGEFHSLVELALKAVRHDMNKEATQSYICVQGLSEEIKNLNLSHLQTRDEKIEKLESISRSYFIYNLTILVKTNY